MDSQNSSVWENAISGSTSCICASPRAYVTAQGPPALLTFQLLQTTESFSFARLWIQRRVSCSYISLTSSNMILPTLGLHYLSPLLACLLSLITIPDASFHSLPAELQRLTLTSKPSLTTPFHTQLPQPRSSALCP